MLEPARCQLPSRGSRSATVLLAVVLAFVLPIVGAAQEGPSLGSELATPADDVAGSQCARQPTPIADARSCSGHGLPVAEPRRPLPSRDWRSVGVRLGGRRQALRSVLSTAALGRLERAEPDVPRRPAREPGVDAPAPDALAARDRDRPRAPCGRPTRPSRASSSRSWRACCARSRRSTPRTRPHEAIYVLVNLTNYYEPGVPGDQYGYDHAGWCNARVLNAPWYRRGVTRYSFDQECGGGRLVDAPNYEVHYKPWVERLVAVGAQQPGAARLAARQRDEVARLHAGRRRRRGVRLVHRLDGRHDGHDPPDRPEPPGHDRHAVPRRADGLPVPPTRRRSGPPDDPRLRGALRQDPARLSASTAGTSGR